MTVFVQYHASLGRTGRLAVLQEKRGSLRLMQESREFTLEGGKGYVLDSLNVSPGFQIEVVFMQGSNFSERYLLARKAQRWHVIGWRGISLGAVRDKKNGETFVGEIEKQEWWPEKGVLRRWTATEDGRWGRPVFTKGAPRRISVEDFSLEQELPN